MDNKDFEIAEPPPFMSAKVYKTKYVEPFINKLIKIVKNLDRRCYRAEKYCTAIENEVSDNMYQRLELDWLIYNALFDSER